MKKQVMIVTGAGQISLAIARRMGSDKTIIVGDRNMNNAEAFCRTLNEAGFTAASLQMDMSDRESIKALVGKGPLQPKKK